MGFPEPVPLLPPATPSPRHGAHPSGCFSALAPDRCQGRGRWVSGVWLRFCRCFWISKLTCSLLCGPVLPPCQGRIQNPGPGQLCAELSPGYQSPGPCPQGLPSGRRWNWAQELRVRMPAGRSQDRLPGRGVSAFSRVLKMGWAGVPRVCSAGTQCRSGGAGQSPAGTSQSGT